MGHTYSFTHSHDGPPAQTHKPNDHDHAHDHASSTRSGRRSLGSSVARDVASIIKFVQSNPLTEDLLRATPAFRSAPPPLPTTPKTSAHRAFKRYVGSSHTWLGSRSGRKMASSSSSSSSATAELFSLPDSVIEEVRRVWPTIEQYLLPIGIRLFIALLESRCEKLPVCRLSCCSRTEGPRSKGCPRQMVLNEELQKYVLLLMGLTKRVVRHLDNAAGVVKLVRKVNRKHFHKLKFDLARIEPDTMAYHFKHSVREILPQPAIWSAEPAYTSLVKEILLTQQKISNSNIGSGHGNGNGSKLGSPDLAKDSEESHESSSWSGGEAASNGHACGDSMFPTFDRHLVLFGCQTFQDFFDLHPEVLQHFDHFRAMSITTEVSVADALRMHSSRVLAIVEDIVSSSGNPDKIRSLLQDLGKQHYKQGITTDHLDMLGPIICHIIRPMVFKSSLWSIEVEKSWAHLFDMVSVLMKRGYPVPAGGPGAGAGGPWGSQRFSGRNGTPGQAFPSLTHVILLKDTWSGIVEQMHDLGLTAIVKLFRINCNLRFYTSPRARYRPTPSRPREDFEQLSVLFNLLISILDHVIISLPNDGQAANMATLTDGSAENAPESDESAENATSSAAASVIRQLDLLREPMEWLGPVFCNTVRPLLLVQGKWSYQVEMAWWLLFQHLVKRNRRGNVAEED